MYPVSDEYRAGLAGAHDAVAEFDVIRDGRAVETDIQVLAGNIDLDGKGSTRRRGSITVEGNRDDLDPFGTEVALRAGIVLPDGTREVVPCGVFGIEEPRQGDDGDGGVATVCDLFDRSKSLAGRRLTRPYPVVAGTDLGDAIGALLLSRRPDLTLSFTSTGTAAGGVFEEGADPWEASRQMAASAGMELFFDPLGNCVLRPVAADMSDVAWEYVEGTTCTMTKVARKRTTEGTYSMAIVTGETTDGAPVVRGEARDEDVNSPTYADGRFGERPTWLRSPFVTAQDQADAAAVALLARSAGLAEGLELSAIPNPAIDVDDLVLVVRAALGINDIYALETISLPLGAKGEMRATTRTRRRVTI